MSFFSILITLSFASTERLSSIYKDLSQADKIFMSAGLVSVIEFPKPIIEVRIGNTAVLKSSISQVSPRELTLFIGNPNLGPTNLIVRADRKIYVLDIIPTPQTHQDYVKISSGYSSPTLKNIKGLEFQGSLDYGKSTPILNQSRVPDDKVSLQ